MSAPRAWRVAAGDLPGLGGAWRDLWSRAQADPFQHPAWLEAWWQVFTPGEPLVVAVGDVSRLDAMAPLWREASTGRVLPWGVGPGDRTDVLVDPLASPLTVATLARSIGELAGSGSVIWPEAPPSGAVARLSPPPGWSRSDSAGSVCPAIDLSGGTQAVPAGRWRKWRMAGHRAARRGEVRLVSARDYGIAGFADLLVRLNAARFSGEDGVFADPRMADLAGRAFAAFADEGLLDAHVLLVGGREAAVQAGFRTGDAASAWLGGFAQDFAFESPGTLLMGMAIRRAIETGARTFDLLRGTESYKHGWGARDVGNRCIVWSRDG